VFKTSVPTHRLQTQDENVMISKALFPAAPVTLLASVALASPPVENVSAEKNPDLAAAQHLVVEGYDKIDAAQKVHGPEMAGHAEKAKALLEQANRELKLAADMADRPHK
jgi:hypothetical protein